MERADLIHCKVNGRVQYLVVQRCSAGPLLKYVLDSKKIRSDAPMVYIRGGLLTSTESDAKVSAHYVGTFPYCVQCNKIMLRAKAASCTMCGRLVRGMRPLDITAGDLIDE